MDIFYTSCLVCDSFNLTMFVIHSGKFSIISLLIFSTSNPQFFFIWNSCFEYQSFDFQDFFFFFGLGFISSEYLNFVSQFCFSTNNFSITLKSCFLRWVFLNLLSGMPPFHGINSFSLSVNAVTLQAPCSLSSGIMRKEQKVLARHTSNCSSGCEIFCFLVGISSLPDLRILTALVKGNDFWCLMPD